MALIDKLDRVPLYAFVILLLIFIAFLQYNPFNLTTNSFNKAPISITYLENICMDKASSGLLYSSLEMFCHNGPLYYLMFGMIKTISPEYFEFLIFLATSLFYILTFVIFHKMLEKEVGSHFFAGFILFILLIPAYSAFRFDLSDLTGFFLFFLGFYILFYTDLKLKEFFVGFLFAFSFLSKQTYAFPIIIAFFLHAAMNLRIISFENRKLAFSKNNIHKAILFVAPISVSIAVFYKFFPLYLVYTYFLSTPSSSGTLSMLYSAVFNIFLLDSAMTSIVLILIFVLSLYFIFKKRDVITLFAFFSILSTLYLFVLSSTVYEYKRLIFIVPFFIIMCCAMAKNPKYMAIGKYVLVLIILMLILPFIKVVYLTFQVSALEQEVGYVWSFLPEQTAMLTDKNRPALYGNIKEINATILQRGMFFTEDIVVSNMLEQRGLIDRQAWINAQVNKRMKFLLKYAEGILSKKYSSFVYLPAGEGQDMDILLAVISKTSKENNIPFRSMFPFYCSVAVPTIEDRCQTCDHTVLAYFQNPDDCKTMKNAVEKYFKGHLANLCNKDKITWRFVADAIINKGGTVTEACLTGGNLLEGYNRRFYLNKADFIVFSILALLVGIYIFKKENKASLCLQLKEAFIENKKFIFVLCLLAFIMITAYLIFLNSPAGSEPNAMFVANNTNAVKECIIITGTKNITIGRTCRDKEECMEKIKQTLSMGKTFSLTDVECQQTYFKTIEDLIECRTDQDCSTSLKEYFPSTLMKLEEITRCGEFGLCQMTVYSLAAAKHL